METGRSAAFGAISQLLNPAQIVNTMNQVQQYDMQKRKNESFTAAVDDLNFRAEKDPALNKRVQAASKMFPNATSGPEEFSRFSSHLTQVEMAESVIDDIEGQGLFGESGVGDTWRKLASSKPEVVLNSANSFVMGQQALSQKQELKNAEDLRVAELKAATSEQAAQLKSYGVESAQSILDSNPEEFDENLLTSLVDDNLGATEVQRGATRDALTVMLDNRNRDRAAELVNEDESAGENVFLSEEDVGNMEGKSASELGQMRRAIQRNYTGAAQVTMLDLHDRAVADMATDEAKRVKDIEGGEKASLAAGKLALEMKEAKEETTEKGRLREEKFQGVTDRIESYRKDLDAEAFENAPALIRALRANGYKEDSDEVSASINAYSKVLNEQNAVRYDNLNDSEEMIAGKNWVTEETIPQPDFHRPPSAQPAPAEARRTQIPMIEESGTIANEAILNNARFQDASEDYSPKRGAMSGLPGRTKNSIISTGDNQDYQVASYGENRIGTRVLFDGNDLTIEPPMKMVKAKDSQTYMPVEFDEGELLDLTLTNMRENIPAGTSPYATISGSAKSWVKFLDKTRGDDPVLASLKEQYKSLQDKTSIGKSGTGARERREVAEKWQEFNNLEAMYKAYLTKSYNQ